MEFTKLQEPFKAEEIEWRVQRSGEKNGKVWAVVLPYISARAIMSRLDEVCGNENWRNRYLPGPNGGLLCGLSIRVNDEWIEKFDGADNTDIEGVKGGLSGALKRSAVMWGIGRYLYDLDASFANVHDKGRFNGEAKGQNGKIHFRWDPPSLPDWAMPKPDTRSHKVHSSQQAPQPVSMATAGPSTSPSTSPDMPELPRIDGVMFEIIGDSIVAKGKTFSKSNMLKGAGFRYDAANKVWSKPKLAA